MTMYSVNVKWGGKKFPNIVANTEDPPLVFKAQLYALTNVEPEKQKVIVMGKPLKDENWSGIKMKDKMTIMMVGTAGSDVPQEPKERPKFIEDMAEEDQNASGLPAGLANLGNTCYLNSTLQCLRASPDLKNAVQNYTNASMEQPSSAAAHNSIDVASIVTKMLGKVFDSLDANDKRGGVTVTPDLLVGAFRRAYPQFAEMNEHGIPAQQDAEECWIQLFRVLQDTLPGTFIKKYFYGRYKEVTKNTEDQSETASEKIVDFHLQKCHISNDINLLAHGIESSLKEKIEKRSDKLERTCVYEVERKIERLPAYLCVEFVRFFWKQEKGKKVKIVRNVKYPNVLDMYSYCSDELKNKLNKVRGDIQKYYDNKMNPDKESIEINGNNQLITEFEDDVGSNNCGKYTLKAILTHQGMSADGGHYIAWVKNDASKSSDKKKGDEWIKYDDDKVSFVKEEEVLKLSGGGQTHCAYMCLYAPYQI